MCRLGAGRGGVGRCRRRQRRVGLDDLGCRGECVAGGACVGPDARRFPPSRMELTATGEQGYSLVLELVEVEEVGAGVGEEEP